MKVDAESGEKEGGSPQEESMRRSTRRMGNGKEVRLDKINALE